MPRSSHPDGWWAHPAAECQPVGSSSSSSHASQVECGRVCKAASMGKEHTVTTAVCAEDAAVAAASKHEPIHKLHNPHPQTDEPPTFMSMARARASFIFHPPDREVMTISNISSVKPTELSCSVICSLVTSRPAHMKAVAGVTAAHIVRSNRGRDAEQHAAAACAGNTTS